MAKKINVDVAVKDKGSKVVKKFEKNVDSSFGGIQKDAKATSKALKKSLGGITTAIKGAITPTKLLGTAMAGLASAAALGYVIKRTIDATAAIKKNAAMAGVSTDAYQELAYASSKYQVEQDALTDGLKELNIRGKDYVNTIYGAAGANDDLGRTFTTLGFSQEEVSQGLQDMPKFFGDVLDSIKTLDKASQINILDKIFGGTAAEQFGLLVDAGSKNINKLKQDARSLGVVLSKDLINNSEKAKSSVDALTTVLSAQFAGLIGDLAPDITEIADGMVKWVKENKEWIKDDLPDKIKELATQLGNVFGAMSKFAGSDEAKFMKEYWEILAGAAIGAKFGGLPGMVTGGLLGTAYQGSKENDALSDNERELKVAQTILKTYEDMGLGNSERAKELKTQVEYLKQEVLYVKNLGKEYANINDPFDILGKMKENKNNSGLETIGEMINLNPTTQTTPTTQPFVGSPDLGDSYRQVVANLDDTSKQLTMTTLDYLKYKNVLEAGVDPKSIGADEIRKQTEGNFNLQNAESIKSSFLQMKGNLEDQRKQYTMTELEYLKYKNVLEAGVAVDSSDADWIRNQTEELYKLGNAGTSVFDDLQQATAGWASNFSSTLNDMVWNAEVSFSSIAESFAKMITQTLIQQSIVSPLVAGITGMDFSSMFSGGSPAVMGTATSPRASGGPVAANKSYLVGEHGREILNMGNRSGSMMSANQSNSSGAGGDMVVNIINNAGANVETQETQSSNGTKSIDVIIDAAVASKVNQRGSATNKALRSGHSTRSQLIKR